MNTLYTIGHSNHAQEHFLALLAKHQIEVLADVRSQPFSRYSSQFNQDELRAALHEAGIQYVFLGKELGGRPDGEQFYDAEGHVLYSCLAESPAFRAGLQRLHKGLNQYRIALMCSEEDPTVCHRFRLVTRVLFDEDRLAIQHIRGDGSLQSESAVREATGAHVHQGVLFAELENETWRSLQSVLPKPPPASSLPD